MSLESIAETLIENVEGIASKQNIEGVIAVFKSLLKAQNELWEKHVVKETNNMLITNNILCKCGNPITVTQYTHKLEVLC